METEQQLLQAINNGDRTAMRRMYDRYSGYAYAVCLRYIADRDTAKDVLQDSFVKIITSISGFKHRGEGTLKAWIMRIVANEALNLLRHNDKIKITDDIPDCADTEAPDVGTIPPEELMRMVKELPDGYRMVINMYVFEQWSHKEIAAKLGIKESTSASQYLRAKKILAKKITEWKRKKNI